jgi:hypothetical protein
VTRNDVVITAADTASQLTEGDMNLEQMMGRYNRQRQELSMAYLAQPWNTDRIDLLANDLAATEREIAALQRPREPWIGPMPGFAQ